MINPGQTWPQSQLNKKIAATNKGNKDPAIIWVASSVISPVSLKMLNARRQATKTGIRINSAHQLLKRRSVNCMTRNMTPTAIRNNPLAMPSLFFLSGFGWFSIFIIFLLLNQINKLVLLYQFFSTNQKKLIPFDKLARAFHVCQTLMPEVGIIQLRIMPLLCQQRIVVAHFDNCSVIHN